ncbi:2-succinyl-6-hydroxy-2,4-cyclohexadiene-1-carboxylate synthase [Neobacillus niacini]|uniref:2-succinyl-6-hydroxy-2, 4-cyclohexadiene-1-carboxylate synthase n=1 Tax=Neobacillus niacini TaxID=86668 RepID=UPI002FFE158B
MQVNSNGLSFHVEGCGSRDQFPMLLLHGFTGDSSTWTSFCSVWGKHSRLIIPDIIGHGKTDAPEEIAHYKMEAAAADIILILDQMEIVQMDVLGYSMGGRLALTIAQLYPERVRKLILVSASPGLKTEEERMLRRMKDRELANFINEHGVKSFVDYWEAIPLFSTMASLPNRLKEVIRKQRLSNIARGLSNSLLGMGTGSQPTWWDRLDKLSCDVLLITGEKDEKFCRIAENMQAEMKKASWIVINDGGHAIHVEQKEKFGTIVSDFLLIHK